MLVYYHPDAPFLLEFVSYALDGRSTNRLEFARQKPDLVIRSAVEFAPPEYKFDILKLEFPANLKFCLA